MAPKLNTKVFTSVDGLELIVKSRKSAVIFEIANNVDRTYKFAFRFDSETFEELLKYIEQVSNMSWASITPKEATSMGSDYWEYYDKELDNNGYLKIQKNTLLLEGPSLESNKLYQFNRPKMESFIYDFKKL